MTTDAQLLEYCQARLKEEGIECFIEVDEYDDTVLRVPALEEGRANQLCYRKCFEFIHGKLQGQPLKGLKVSSPVEGEDYYDIYCYDPDVEGRALVGSDVRVWSVYSNNNTFDWTWLVDDDSAWNEDWDGHAESNTPRLFFLASVLGAELIDLPAPAPLTMEDLVAWLATCDDRGLYCDHPQKGEAARLKLKDGHLELEVVEMNSTGLNRKVLSTHTISASNIDAAGRLTLNGHVILTRATLN